MDLKGRNKTAIIYKQYDCIPKGNPKNRKLKSITDKLLKSTSDKVMEYEVNKQNLIIFLC